MNFIGVSRLPIRPLTSQFTFSSHLPKRGASFNFQERAFSSLSGKPTCSFVDEQVIVRRSTTCASKRHGTVKERLETSTASSSHLLCRNVSQAVANDQSTPSAPSSPLPLTAMPGPGKWLPYFGTFFQFVSSNVSKNALGNFLKWQSQYGNIFVEKFLGDTRVYVSDPESVEKICRAEGKLPSKENVPVLTGMKEICKITGISLGLAESEGEEWTRKRKIFSKRLLRPIEMKNYFSLFNDSAIKGVKYIEGICQKNNYVVDDVKDVLIRWSMDSHTTFAFGRPFGFMSDTPSQDAVDVYDAMDDFLEMLGIHKSLPPLWQKLSTRRMEAAIKKWKTVHDISERRFEKAMDDILEKDANENSASSFAEYLLTKEELSKEESIAYLMSVMAGGYDTTTATTESLLYQLGKHQDKQQILFEEIQQFVPESGEMDYNTSQRMPYLRACMKESARLVPAAFFFLRNLEEDIVVNGYLVPKKTNLLCNNLAMSRNPDIYPNPSEFIPERWLRSNEDPPHPYSSLPFGTGVRSCVGRRVAEGNMHAFLSQFLRRFKIEEVLSEFDPVIKLLLTNGNKLTLKLSER